MIGIWPGSTFKLVVSIGSFFLLLTVLVACGESDPSGTGRVPGEEDPSHTFTPMPESNVTLHFGVAGQPFVLERSGSQDDGAGFTWRQVSGPFVFTTREGSLLTFVPQVPGTYVFELMATDAAGLSSVAARRAIVVQGEQGPDSSAPAAPLTCAVALLPLGASFDEAMLDGGHNTNWDFCGGGLHRAGPPLLVDGAAPVLVSIAKLNTHGPAYPPESYRVEIGGVVQEGVTGIYSEKAFVPKDASAAVPSAREAEAGQAARSEDADYGSITIRSSQVNDHSLHEWYKKALSGTTDRKSGSIIYLDREGNEVMRVTWNECFPTGYRPFVIDGVVAEPVEEVTLQCSLGSVEAEGPGGELYQWLSDAFQGKAEPRTLAVWEVLPDGSAGRAFLYHGAFPKEWTLPSMAPSEVTFNPREYVLTKGLSNADVVEEIEFAVERVERAK